MPASIRAAVPPATAVAVRVRRRAGGGWGFAGGCLSACAACGQAHKMGRWRGGAADGRSAVAAGQESPAAAGRRSGKDDGGGRPAAAVAPEVPPGQRYGVRRPAGRTAGGARRRRAAAGAGSRTQRAEPRGEGPQGASPLARRTAQSERCQGVAGEHQQRQAGSPVNPARTPRAAPAPPTGRVAGPRWCRRRPGRRFRTRGLLSAGPLKAVKASCSTSCPAPSSPAMAGKLSFSRVAVVEASPVRASRASRMPGTGSCPPARVWAPAARDSDGECHHGRAQGVERRSGGCAHGTLPSPAAGHGCSRGRVRLRAVPLILPAKFYRAAKNGVTAWGRRPPCVPAPPSRSSGGPRSRNHRTAGRRRRRGSR